MNPACSKSTVRLLVHIKVHQSIKTTADPLILRIYCPESGQSIDPQPEQAKLRRINAQNKHTNGVHQQPEPLRNYALNARNYPFTCISTPAFPAYRCRGSVPSMLSDKAHQESDTAIIKDGRLNTRICLSLASMSSHCLGPSSWPIKAGVDGLGL